MIDICKFELGYWKIREKKVAVSVQLSKENGTLTWTIAASEIGQCDIKS